MNARSPLLRVVLVAPAWLAGASCMEPLVDDAIDEHRLILPAGTVLPRLVDDQAAEAQVSANIADELRGLIRVHVGFHAGESVDWWDLGPASPTPIAGYLLVEESPEGDFLAEDRRFKSIGAPAILTAVPGDLGYSPLWRVIIVPVTHQYAGEVLASIDALDAARVAGLVEAPIRVPYARNSPVVMPDARLEPAAGAEPEAPATAYYKGKRVDVFRFGQLFAPGNNLAVASQYSLRRDGGEPISEVARRVDITGDGDAQDTNDLFAAPTSYSPLVHPVEVVVPAATQAIDTFHDQAQSDLTSAGDLFMPDQVTPAPDVVLSLYPSEAIFNRPFTPHADVPEDGQ